MTKLLNKVTLELKDSKGNTLSREFEADHAKRLLDRKSGWELKSNNVKEKDGDFIKETSTGQDRKKSEAKGD